MRDELNIPRSTMGAASVGNGGYAPIGPGGVNASFRVPRRHDSKTGNPRIMAYVAAGLVITIGAFVVVSGLAGARHGTGLPVVEADSRPLRVKPDKAGGMAMEGGDEALLADEKGGAITLAPAPEAPAPAALKKQALEAAQAEAARMEAARMAATRPEAAQAEAAKRGAHPAAPTIAAAVPPPAPPLAPKPVVVAAQTAPAHAALATPAAVKPAAAPGGASVQLAALVSEHGAQAEWDRLAKKFPGLFAGHKPVITKLERDGKTFWRLRTAGFPTHTAAMSFCEKAKASGQGCVIEKS